MELKDVKKLLFEYIKVIGCNANYDDYETYVEEIEKLNDKDKATFYLLRGIIDYLEEQELRNSDYYNV